MLARKALLIFAVNLVGAALGLVGNYFIGHYMGPVPLGMWATALALIGIVSFLGDFGLSFAHRKRISEAGADLAAHVGTFLFLRNLAMGAMVLVVLGGLVLWLIVLGKDFTDATTVRIVLLALLHQVVVLLVIVPKDTFYGLGRIAQAEATNLTEHFVRLPLIVGVALLFAFTHGRDVAFSGLFETVRDALPLGERYDAATGGLLIGLATVGSVAASLLVATALFGWHRYPVGRPRRDVARRYWTYALPIGLLAGVSVFSAYFDTVMVSYFWGAADAGHYFAAQRIATLLLAISMALFTTLFPKISSLASRADAAGLRKTFRDAERWISFVIWPLVAVNVVLATPIMRLVFGNQFLPAAPILAALSLYVLVLSINRPYQALVAGAGTPATLFAAGMLTNAANLVGNLLLIPDSILGVQLAGMKGTGAALATLSSTIIGFLYFRYRGAKLTDVAGVHRPHVKHAIAAVAGGLSVWLPVHLAVVGEPLRVWEIAGAALVIGVVYLLVLRLLGEVGRKELGKMGDTMHPWRMVRYFWQELRHGRHEAEERGPGRTEPSPRNP